MGKARASEKVDQELAAKALAKRQQGGKPTRDEAAALRRVERRRDEEMRAEAYASVPKKTWRAWSGHLQYKTLDDLADKFGIPTRGKTVDLAEVVRWLYQFLRHEPQKHAAADPDDEDERPDPKRERLHWESKRSELRYYREAAVLVDLGDVLRGFSEIAEIMRRAGEALRVEHGDAAAKILTNAWDDVDAKIDLLFGADDSSESDS